MSDCKGNLSLGSKVDRDMIEYIESESERLGVTRAEFVRRLLDLYRMSRREELDCPECESPVVMDLGGR